MKIVGTFLVLLFCGFSVYGQNSPVPTQIVTDRPSFSASSRAVPYKALQIETGFLVNVSKSESSTDFGSSTMSFPTPMVRWGVLKGVELRLFNTFFRKKDNHPSIPVDERNQYGLGNLIVGTKVNLTKAKGIIPEMAVLAHAVFQTGKVVVRESEKVLFDIAFSMTHPISDKYSLGYNLGYASSEESANGNGFYSVIFGFGISEKFSGFFEGFGLWKNFENGTFNFDGGLSYSIKPNLQLDMAAGTGFTQRNYFITIGFSMLFAELY